MSVIDAAIIKALVEHIGGNPDDVVVGGSSGRSFLQAEWSTLSNDILIFTLPEGQKIEIGTAIRIHIDEMGQEPLTYYCCEIGKDISDRTKYVFRSPEDSAAVEIVDETTHFKTNMSSDKVNLPDNTTYGLYNVSTVSDLVSLVMWLLRKAREE